MIYCLQDHLGEVVFVELPEPGGSVSKGKGFGAVESVKATSDVNSPISGEIVEVNSKLTEAPGLVILSFQYNMLFLILRNYKEIKIKNFYFLWFFFCLCLARKYIKHIFYFGNSV